MLRFKKRRGWYGAGLCLSVLFLSVCTKAPDNYCGDGREINKHTEFCFNGEIYQKCGGGSYDPPTQFCHENAILSRCANQQYNPGREFCSANRIYTKCEGYAHEYNPLEQGCINDLLKSRCSRNFYDPDIEFCADDNRVYNLCNGQPFSPAQGCGGVVVQPKCGETHYDDAINFCSNNVIHNLCGGAEYDPTTHKCENNEVKIIDNGGDSTVTVTFELAVNLSPIDGGTVTGSGTFNEGTNAAIEAMANAGYRFVGWTGDGIASDTSANTTVLMDAAKTVTANFELIPPNYYTLTVSANPADCATTLTNSGEHEEGTNTPISATAAANCTFTEWTGATGITNTSSANTSVLMDSAKTVTANFTQDLCFGDTSAQPGSACCQQNPNFNGCQTSGDPLTDSRDGQTYRTVIIGSQTWMAENLNFNAPGSVCYDNIESNCNTYGRLYDWSTVMNFPSSCDSSSCDSLVQSQHQGICPSDWHVPSDAEWEALVKYVDPNATDNINVAGTKLKSATGWNTDSGYIPGTNDFGFSALPGASGNGSDFFNVGSIGYWWSVTECDVSCVWGRLMYYSDSDVSSGAYNKISQFAVRCVMN